MNIQILRLGGTASVRLCLALFAVLMLARCAHTETSAEDPDALFAEAEEAFTDERYLVALEKYRDIKNRFPYSNRATDAELRIADTHFAQEAYLEAGSAYEIFRELHPTHPKSDYVQYRTALSYYRQIPSNPTRDLTAAYKAIDEFNTLMEKFPRSGFSEEAKTLVQEARKRLAEYEAYVADFYYQRRHFLSASYRYSALLQDYPNLGYDEEALFRLGVSYEKTRMFSNARDALRRLLNQYPTGQYSADAKSLLDELSKQN